MQWVGSQSTLASYLLWQNACASARGAGAGRALMPSGSRAAWSGCAGDRLELTIDTRGVGLPRVPGAGAGLVGLSWRVRPPRRWQRVVPAVHDDAGSARGRVRGGSGCDRGCGHRGVARPSGGDRNAALGPGQGARSAHQHQHERAGLVVCRAIDRLVLVYDWAMSKPAAALVVSQGQREMLARLAVSRTAAHREVQRAQVLSDASRLLRSPRNSWRPRKTRSTPDGGARPRRAGHEPG
jgi:hypothetical protein